MPKRLADCQRVIGHHFSNPALLEIALTHSSVRTPDRECNERQEFLGDSVLGLVITEELYKRLPDQQEGELTRIKSAVVSRGALYRVSMRLGLPRFVEIAKGVARKDELPVSLTANLVESIIGAIYLDAGFFPAREFVLRHLGPELDDVLNDRVPKNFKSLLQHECQRILGTTPSYRTLDEGGPDHRKSFVVAAVVRGTEYGRATGVTKKEAEQEAARKALETLSRRGRGRRRRGGAGEDRLREAAPEGRGRRGRGAARAPLQPTSDDDAWRTWAEAGAGPSPLAPASTPVAPEEFVVGPEPEEAYLEAPPAPREPVSAVAPEADAAEPDEATEGEGRRRRSRRRRRRGEEPDGPSERPKAAPEPAAERGGRRPSSRPARDRPERAPRERAPRPEPTAATAAAAPPAPPTRARPSFGAGVVSDSAAAPPRPAPPSPAERAVTAAGSVEGRKKAPTGPSQRPGGGGGFGSGIE
jgi:ribonuclease-3